MDASMEGFSFSEVVLIAIVAIIIYGASGPRWRPRG